MSLPIIRTERLILRPWRKDDLDSFAKINADPKVMEFYTSVLTREESDALALKFQKEFNERGYGFWAVEVPGVADFIGYVGLNYWNLELPFAPCIDIGWRLDSSFGATAMQRREQRLLFITVLKCWGFQKSLRWRP